MKLEIYILRREYLIQKNTNGEYKLYYKDIQEIKIREGFLVNSIIITTKNGEKELEGLSEYNLNKLYSDIRQKVREALADDFIENNKDFVKIDNIVQEIYNSRGQISNEDSRYIISLFPNIEKYLSKPLFDIDILPEEIHSKLLLFQKIKNYNNTERMNVNNELIANTAKTSDNISEVYDNGDLSSYEDPEPSTFNISNEPCYNINYSNNSDNLSENIIITEEFQKALDAVLKTKKHLFITGKAGTGKSTLLRLLRERTNKKTVYLAPTGVAAINIQGQTIHSFFRLPPELITERHVIIDHNRRNMYKALETIVIDEISMVRADILHGIDLTLRKNRNNNIPFGGVQMVFFGDLHQLTPIVKGKDEKNYFTDTYGGEYFFNAPEISHDTLEMIELTRIFRQKSELFISLLNCVRENDVSDRELDLLNSRTIEQDISDENDELFITLTATNKVAESINMSRLKKIPEPEALYHAIITDIFDQSSYPTLDQLKLKPSAQIMMVKNDKEKRWVNGNVGTIVELEDDIIKVSIKNEIYEVERETWEAIEYKYNRETRHLDKTVAGTFTQFPIKLAWAITIHKSQGQTFDNLIINMGDGAFTHGQTYVALSRCTSFEGLYLTKPIKHRDLKTDSRVISFLERMKHESPEEFEQTHPRP